MKDNSQLAEIKRRYKQGETRWHLDDVALLLSLLDSQAAGSDREAERVAMEGIKEGLRRRDERAATRMRDRCVEKVERASYYHDSRCLCVTAVHGDCDCGAKARHDKLIKELQSLTLEGEQEK